MFTNCVDEHNLVSQIADEQEFDGVTHTTICEFYQDDRERKSDRK